MSVLAALVTTVVATLFAAPAPDDDSAATAELELADRLRRSGEYEKAIRELEALAGRHAKSPLASRALARAGAIAEWDLGDLRRAIRLYDLVLSGPDEAPGVRSALRRRLALERELRGAGHAVALAHELYERRRGAEYAPFLLLSSARLLFDDLARPEDALRPLETLLSAFAASALADDARFLEARVLRQLGRPDEALTSYRAIVATHTDSFLFADYNSSLLDDAYFGIAETLERDLGRPAEAKEAYVRLTEAMPESILKEKALRRASALAASLGHEGRARTGPK